MKMTIEEVKRRSRAFEKDMNEELAPILKIVCIKERFSRIAHECLWQVFLCDTKYARTDEVSPDGNREFLNLVKRKSVKHFEQQANFNNSGTIFWEIIDSEEEQYD